MLALFIKNKNWRKRCNAIWTKHNEIKKKLKKFKTNSKKRKIYKYQKKQLLIYKSKEGTNINLNDKALDENNERIVCRHLAYYMVLNSKDYHENLKSRKKISEQPILKENHFDKLRIMYKSKYYNLFKLDEFGNQLYSIAKNLKAKEQKKLLFCSTAHVMTLIILRKDNKYVIKFYDPNKTTMHKRAICANLNAVKNLSMNEFLDHEDIEDYFSDYKSGVLYSHEMKNNTDSEIIYNSKPSNKLLFYGLAFNLTNLVLKICNQINNKVIDNNKKFSLLAAKATNETPGFYMALQEGHTETVKVFVEAICNSKLRDHQKFELLAVKATDETPGFYMALQEGHTETVKVFVEAICNSKLRDHQKFELLAAKATDETPGFFMALQKGHTKTVKIFVEVICNSKLHNNQKFELLAAKRNDDLSGFFMALQKGHTKTVKIFVEVICNSKLHNNQKFELLAAKRNDNLSGFFMALQKKYAETVEAYVITVLDSRLPISKKDQLISTCILKKILDFPNQKKFDINIKKLCDFIIMKNMTLDYKNTHPQIAKYFETRFIDDMLEESNKLNRLNTKEYWFIKQNSNFFEEMLHKYLQKQMKKSKLSSNELLQTLRKRYKGATIKFSLWGILTSENPISNICYNAMSCSPKRFIFSFKKAYE